MSIYTTISSVEKDVKIVLSNGKEKKFHMELYLQHPVGSPHNANVLEIVGVDHEGRLNYVLIPLSDFIIALNLLLYLRYMKDFEIWNITDEIDKMIKELKEAKENEERTRESEV